MSRFNLSDIQSSTLLYATDSLDEMFDVVQPMIQTHGPSALAGLTLSIQTADPDQTIEVDDEKIMLLLQSRKEHTSTATRH